jgi:hypothetical protein
MAVIDTTLTTAKGDLLPATTYPGGSKLPAGEIVIDGNVWGADHPAPVAGEMTLAEEDLGALTGALDAVADAVTDAVGVFTGDITPGLIPVDDIYTTLGASPGHTLVSLTDVIESLNAWLAELKPGASTAATTGTAAHYIHGDRVWFQGRLEIADEAVSTTVAVLPAAARPASLRTIAVRVEVDIDGTPSVEDGELTIATDGTVELASPDLTGHCGLTATHLSYRRS